MTSRLPLGSATLFLIALAATSPRTAEAHDLALTALRAPDTVRLTDHRLTAPRRVVVRIQNRGDDTVTLPDAAHVAALVHLDAAANAGPIVCGLLTPRLRPLRGVRFPFDLPPGRTLVLVYDVRLTCATDPGASADWRFAATLDVAGALGLADDDPANDVCPRQPAGDRGCGIAIRAGARDPVVTDVRDARDATRFALPGPFAVGRVVLQLVDSSRVTMPNGDYPGGDPRALRTVVWYPATGAGGNNAPVAIGGAPYPLVIFSHGLGAVPEQSTFLTTYLASQGYVVAAPTFPLASFNAPGGPTIADQPAQAGDISFVIDTLLGFSAEPGNRFAGAVDADRIALTGHSNGGLATLVTAYDRTFRDPRVKAALPLAGVGCFFEAGYFTDVTVPLVILQGDKDLLVDVHAHAENIFMHANPPKILIVIHGGNHLGFSDFGDIIDDVQGCNFLPEPPDLAVQAVDLVRALGGAANGVGVQSCLNATPCAGGDPSHIDAGRQQQITNQVAGAFFASVLRGDARAAHYLAAQFAPTTPDVTVESAP